MTFIIHKMLRKTRQDNTAQLMSNGTVSARLICCRDRTRRPTIQRQHKTQQKDKATQHNSHKAERTSELECTINDLMTFVAHAPSYSQLHRIKVVTWTTQRHSGCL